MVEEIWKPIIGYEGLYEISNYGSIRSVERTVISKNGRVLKQKGILLKTNKRGRYTCKSLFKDGGSRAYTVHRLVALVFLPNSENKPHINHIDNDRYNNYVGNLEWVTQKENLIHAANQGRMSKPPVNYTSLERLQQVKELLEQGISRTEIAKRLKMSRHTMYDYFGSDKDYKSGKQQTAPIACYPVDFLPVIENAIELGFGS